MLMIAFCLAQYGLFIYLISSLNIVAHIVWEEK
jgi:hypothetical protein